MQAVSDLGAFGADVAFAKQAQLAVNEQLAPAACEHRRGVVGHRRVSCCLWLVEGAGNHQLYAAGVLPEVTGELVSVLKVQSELWKHHHLRACLGCCGERLKHGVLPCGVWLDGQRAPVCDGADLLIPDDIGTIVEMRDPGLELATGLSRQIFECGVQRRARQRGGDFNAVGGACRECCVVVEPSGKARGLAVHCRLAASGKGHWNKPIPFAVLLDHIGVTACAGALGIQWCGAGKVVVQRANQGQWLRKDGLALDRLCVLKLVQEGVVVRRNGRLVCALLPTIEPLIVGGEHPQTDERVAI